MTDTEDVQCEWFVLYAELDESYSLVPSLDVICDENVAIGDKVAFVYGSRKKTIEGVVKAKGTDRDKLARTMKDLNKKSPKRAGSFHADQPRNAKLKCKESMKSAGTSSKSSENKTIKKKSSSKSVLGKVLEEYQSDDQRVTDIEDSDSSSCELTPQEIKAALRAAQANKSRDQNLLREYSQQGASRKRLDFGLLSTKGFAARKHSEDVFTEYQSDKSFEDLNGTEDNEKEESDTASGRQGRKRNEGKEIKGKGDKDTNKEADRPEKDVNGESMKSKESDDGLMIIKNHEDTKDDDSEDIGDKDERSANEKQGPKIESTKRSRPRKVRYEKKEFSGEFFNLSAGSPNAIQLSSAYKVYVDSNRLREIKRESKSILAIARRLTPEVFTKEAIMQCTVTGRPSSARPGVPSVIRPPLHPDGVNAIFEYCKTRAKSGDGPTFTSVKKSISDVVNETRYIDRLAKEAEGVKE